MRHNGVNGKQFTVQDRQEIRRKLGLSQDRAILCYVGNLSGKRCRHTGGGDGPLHHEGRKMPI